jgi:hypothetical protein
MSTIATRLGWTGWLLVLVYFGALTAISDYIAHWFLFSEELLFYDVFITVIISTVVLYVLALVYSTLRDKNSTSKWWGRGLKILSVIFGVIGFVYLSIGLISYLSIGDFRSDTDGFRRNCIRSNCRIVYPPEVWLVCCSFTRAYSDSCYHGFARQRKSDAFYSASRNSRTDHFRTNPGN